MVTVGMIKKVVTVLPIKVGGGSLAPALYLYEKQAWPVIFLPIASCQFDSGRGRAAWPARVLAGLLRCASVACVQWRGDEEGHPQHEGLLGPTNTFTPSKSCPTASSDQRL